MQPTPQKDMSNTANYIVIDSISNDFDMAIFGMKKAKVIGLAMEGIRDGRLGEPCWLQISLDEYTFLFDMVTLKNDAFDEGLKDVIEDCKIVKVVHDCRAMSDYLHHCHDIRLSNVFDTQAADFILFRMRNMDLLPMRVNNLTTCLMMHLGLPPTLFSTRYLKVVKDETPEIWKHRPASDAVLEAAVFHVCYLAKLRLRLIDLLLKRFTDGCDVYLGLMRDAGDNQIARLETQMHLVPSEFEDLAFFAESSRLRREELRQREVVLQPSIISNIPIQNGSCATFFNGGSKLYDMVMHGVGISPNRAAFGITEDEDDLDDEDDSDDDSLIHDVDYDVLMQDVNNTLDDLCQKDINKDDPAANDVNSDRFAVVQEEATGTRSKLLGPTLEESRLEKPVESLKNLVRSLVKPVVILETANGSLEKVIRSSEKPVGILEKLDGPTLEESCLEKPVKSLKNLGRSLVKPVVILEMGNGSLEKPIRSSEKPVGNVEKPVESLKNLARSLLKPVGCLEKLVRSSENPVLSLEKLDGSFEKPIRSSEKAFGNLEKTVESLEDLVRSSEKPVLNLEKLVGSLEKPNRSSEKAVWNLERTVESLEDLVRSSEKPVLSLEKLDGSLGKPIRSSEKAVGNLEKTVESLEDLVKSLGKPIGCLEKLVRPFEKPVVSLEKLDGSLETLVRSSEKPVEGLETPMGSLEKVVGCSEKLVGSVEPVACVEETVGDSEKLVGCLEQPVGCSEKLVSVNSFISKTETNTPRDDSVFIPVGQEKFTGIRHLPNRERFVPRGSSGRMPFVPRRREFKRRKNFRGSRSEWVDGKHSGDESPDNSGVNCDPKPEELGDHAPVCKHENILTEHLGSVGNCCNVVGDTENPVCRDLDDSWNPVDEAIGDSENVAGEDDVNFGGSQIDCFVLGNCGLLDRGKIETSLKQGPVRSRLPKKFSDDLPGEILTQATSVQDRCNKGIVDAGGFKRVNLAACGRGKALAKAVELLQMNRA